MVARIREEENDDWQHSGRVYHREIYSHEPVERGQPVLGERELRETNNRNQLRYEAKRDCSLEEGPIIAGSICFIMITVRSETAQHKHRQDKEKNPPQPNQHRLLS